MSYRRPGGIGSRKKRENPLLDCVCNEWLNAARGGDGLVWDHLLNVVSPVGKHTGPFDYGEDPWQDDDDDVYWSDEEDGDGEPNPYRLTVETESLYVISALRGKRHDERVRQQCQPHHDRDAARRCDRRPERQGLQLVRVRPLKLLVPGRGGAWQGAQRNRRLRLPGIPRRIRGGPI